MIAPFGRLDVQHPLQLQRARVLGHQRDFRKAPRTVRPGVRTEKQDSSDVLVAAIPTGRQSLNAVTILIRVQGAHWDRPVSHFDGVLGS
jgi:hypothetical protein